VRTLAPEIPWPKIIGMRNVAVHGYFDAGTDIVWQAVTSDIAVLKPPVERLTRQIESNQARQMLAAALRGGRRTL